VQDRKCGAELILECLAALREMNLTECMALLEEAKRRAEKEFQAIFTSAASLAF
jgi:hypothetical protein